MIGHDDVIFGLPEDFALAARSVDEGTARWRDVVAAVTSYYQQRGEVMVEYWVDGALAWWRDAGYPPQPVRNARCSECWEPLDGAYCAACDLAYGESWWKDSNKRVGIGLHGRPWRFL